MEDYLTVLPWNDSTAAITELREHGENVAAVILEPINYNGGATLPLPVLLCSLFPTRSAPLAHLTSPVNSHAC